MRWSVIYSVFLISIFEDSMQGPTRVPKACRELSESITKCFKPVNKFTQDPKVHRSNCKKLPRIARKCQKLSESWQLLAETCQKKAPKAKVKKKNRNFCKKEDSDKIKNLKPIGYCAAYNAKGSLIIFIVLCE